VRLLDAALNLLGVKTIIDLVTRVDCADHQVRVFTASEEFRAERGLIATGASGLPEGLVSGARNAVRPVRGVTMRVQGPDRSDVATVRAYVRGRAFYMVSRPGATACLVRPPKSAPKQSSRSVNCSDSCATHWTWFRRSRARTCSNTDWASPGEPGPRALLRSLRRYRLVLDLGSLPSRRDLAPLAAQEALERVEAPR